ncbi:MAG: Ku protein [Candidatus Rokuibacteriota bacterium]|nr:MAG: Ku protein [Candidatus Rokubacteria bacterium]
MPPHSMGSGTISFGLVSIPVKMFTAASGAGVSFNLLHEKCGNRIKQQQVCPVCNEVVDRTQLVRGFEFAKEQYVRFTEEELKQLEQENSKMIEIEEFVPLEQVDPIYYEKTFYLGPDAGGEKAYRLLADAMTKTNRVALAKFVMRGKENLVLIRPAQGGLMLHSMFFGDEVRDFGEVDKGESAKLKSGELELAERLIDELASEKFDPAKYHDEYRDRVLEIVNMKVEGKQITTLAPQAERAQVIDLMDALKQSLEERGARAGKAKPERKPAAKAARVAEAAPKRKTASKR